MKIKVLSLLFFVPFLALAQTKAQPSQINIIVSVAPPTTSTFFATEGQKVYSLTIPATYTEILKVEVYRNGFLQSDVSSTRIMRDYSLSTDRKTITFEDISKPGLDDIIRVIYWMR